jgi:hypothetical protein
LAVGEVGTRHPAQQLVGYPTVDQLASRSAGYWANVRARPDESVCFGRHDPGRLIIEGEFGFFGPGQFNTIIEAPWRCMCYGDHKDFGFAVV